MIENNKNKEEYIFGRSNIPNKFDEEKFKTDLLKGIEFIRNFPVPERTEHDEIRDSFIKASDSFIKTDFMAAYSKLRLLNTKV